MQKAIGVWVLVTPRPQGPSRRSCYLIDLLLTAKTIYIHKFYFLQSTFLGGQIKKKGLTRGWIEVDSWLEIDLGSWMAHATLQLITFDRIFLGLLPQSFKMNVPSPHQFIDFSFCIGYSQDLRGNFIRCKSHIVPNLIPRVSLLCLPWSLEERPWLWLVTWPPVTQTLSLG